MTRRSLKIGPIRPIGQIGQIRRIAPSAFGRAAGTASCAVFKPPPSSTTGRSFFAGASSIRARAPTIRWCRRRAAAGRTSPKATAPGATSSASEIRLTNVARASLDELLLDYEDFLRQRQLPQWAKDSPEAIQVRQLGMQQSDPTDRSDPTDPSDHAAYAPWIEHPDPGRRGQHPDLPDPPGQLSAGPPDRRPGAGTYRKGWLPRKPSGGPPGRAGAAAGTFRSDGSVRSDRSVGSQTPPACPNCAKPMRLRTARQGKNAGTRFWGCRDYPDCKGTRPLEASGKQQKSSDRSDPSDRLSSQDRQEEAMSIPNRKESRFSAASPRPIKPIRPIRRIGPIGPIRSWARGGTICSYPWPGRPRSLHGTVAAIKRSASGCRQFVDNSRLRTMAARNRVGWSFGGQTAGKGQTATPLCRKPKIETDMQCKSGGRNPGHQNVPAANSEPGGSDSSDCFRQDRFIGFIRFVRSVGSIRWPSSRRGPSSGAI